MWDLFAFSLACKVRSYLAQIDTELRIKGTYVMWRSAWYFHVSNTMTQTHCLLECLQHEVGKIIFTCV